MKKISDILGGQANFKNMIKNVSIKKCIQQNWDFIFGNLSKDLIFNMYRDGVLTIETLNFSWSNEIQAFKGLIIKRITDCCGKGIKIKAIKVKYALPAKKKIEKKMKREVYSIDPSPMSALENESSREAEQRLEQRFYSKRIVKNRYFLKKIESDIEEKKRNGYTLCLLCQRVYWHKSPCVFCENMLR